jgi:hypothetical protein
LRCEFDGEWRSGWCADDAVLVIHVDHWREAWHAGERA